MHLIQSSKICVAFSMKSKTRAWDRHRRRRIDLSCGVDRSRYRGRDDDDGAVLSLRSMRKQVELVLRERFSEALSVQVRLVFDPPWSFDRLSQDALAALGWSPRSKASDKEFSLRCWNVMGQSKH